MASLTVRQLYTSGSLRNATDGFCFAIENRLSDTVVTRLASLQVDGHEIPADHLQLELSSGEVVPVPAVTPEHPLAFAQRACASVHAFTAPLAAGPHEIDFVIETTPFGTVQVRAEDAVSAAAPAARTGVPYVKDDSRNYSQDMAAARRRYVEAVTGVTLR
ncbi:MAG: hypothetical protein ACM368_03250, partial [Gemmatimonadota bacterium]